MKNKFETYVDLKIEKVFSNLEEKGTPITKENQPELEKHFRAAARNGDRVGANAIALFISKRASENKLLQEDYPMVAQVFGLLGLTNKAIQYIEPDRAISRQRRSYVKSMEIYFEVDQILKNGFEGGKATLNGGVKSVSAFDLVATKLHIKRKSVVKHYYDFKKNSPDF